MDKIDIDAVQAALRRPYGHISGAEAYPNRSSANLICNLLLNQLFPGFFSATTTRDRDHRGTADLEALRGELEVQIGRALHALSRIRGDGVRTLPGSSAELAQGAIAGLPGIRDLLQTDVEAAFDNDPAAGDRETIILSYPCIEALAIQRFAHGLYGDQVPILPRMLTEVAHSRTGIDIHPGAAIGPSFFIDHGTGVVIGETSTIGEHCVLYQGVTLGAWNPTAKDGAGDLRRGASNKRHPDLEDHVTVYAGATILGGGTRIGHHSVIGGKVWLTHSVEAHSVVMIEEPKLTIRRRKDLG